MSKQKRSFFERLTGTVKADEDNFNIPDTHDGEDELIQEDSVDGELPIDVYNKATEIIVKTMVAGIRPENLEIDITRSMVSIKGTRQETAEVEEKDYYHKELYWGTFARSVTLPEEIDVEEAEATEKNGLLTIRLPKIDKAKQNKLKVRST
jgi:HSP20 family molecular chaperone IbpA